MNRPIVMVIAGLLVVGLCAGPASAQGTTATFDWSAQGLVITYPAAWSVQELAADKIAFLADSKDAASLTSNALPQAPLILFFVTTDPVQMFGQAFAAATLEEAARDWLTAATGVQQQPETTQVAGLEAVRGTGPRASLQADITTLFIPIPDGRLLLMLLVAPTGTAEEALAAFDPMAASLVIAGVNDRPALGASTTWEEKGLTMGYPAAWTAQVTSLGDVDALALVADPAALDNLVGSVPPDSPVVLVIVTDDPAGLFGLSPSDTAPDELLRGLAVSGRLDGAEQITPEPMTLAGQDALHLGGRSANGSYYYTFTAAALPGGSTLLVVSVAPADQQEAFAPLLEAMLASLTWSGGAASATGPAALAVTVVQALPLEGITPNQVLYAADGRSVVYQGQQPRELCRYDVAEGTTRCLTLDESVGETLIDRGYVLWPSALSPDGTRLALVGMAFYYFRDTDLQVVDLTTGALSVLAPDNYEGRLLGSSPGAVVDVQPVWSPDGTQIAVERTVAAADAGLGNAAITIVDAASGQARQVTLLPGHETEHHDSGSTWSIAWSPDGAALALSIAHVELEAADGLWRVDLTSGELQRVAHWESIEAVYQTIYPEMPVGIIRSLSWSPDGTRLLFWASDSVSTGAWPLWVDLASGSITALPLPAVPDENPTQRAIQPRQAVWSPEGSALLVGTVERARVPGEDLLLLDPAAEYGRNIVGVRLVDVESGQSRLLGHLPQLTAGEEAAWGPQGDVLIDDYYLRLSPE